MPKTSKENRKLHKLWRAGVLLKDNGYCQICGPDKYNKVLNAHHLIPKEFKEYRWDVDNGMILCVNHHTLGRFSAHKNPFWFVHWLGAHKPKIHLEVVRRINGLT